MRGFALLGMMCTGWVALFACKPPEPPPAYPGDLGEADVPLPPPGGVRKVTNLSDVNAGRAEWRPFELRTDDALAERRTASPKASEEESEEPPSDDEALLAEVRDLIAGYNELVEKGEFDALGEYFVPEQRAAFEGLLEVTERFAQAVEELRAALDAKSPGAGQAAGAFAAAIPPDRGLKIEVVSLSVEGDGKVVGQSVAGNDRDESAAETLRTIRFAVREDEWFIELPALAGANQMIAQMSAVGDQVRQWAQAVQSGRMPAEAVVSAIDQALQIMGKAKPEASGEAGSEEEEDRE